MGAIKAIETEYAGHLFRSRLEARWAVFFDHAQTEWKYEPQGYTVGRAGLPYLPDFWLPKSQLWVEVKGAFDMESLALVGEAAGFDGLPLSLDNAQRPADVAPRADATWSVMPVIPRILILGDIPRVEPHHAWVHPILVMVSGNHVAVQSGYFWGKKVRRLADIFGMPASPEDFSPHDGQPIYELAHGGPIADAYRAARSARFEHGKSGAML